jgi:transcription termination factor NusB
MNIKKNQLIRVLIIMIIGMLTFTSCSSTQEPSPSDTSLLTKEEDSTDVIKETEVQQSEDYGAKGAALKAEATHISYMEDLYETYELELPNIDPSQHIILPESINYAYLAGVEAEIINIAMYERFLEQDLPEDVLNVFEQLKEGSESHLQAFKKNVR